jgi:SAM-dependent methyltransferase
VRAGAEAKSGSDSADPRAQREKEAYDERGLGALNGNWHNRFRHVFECPNAVHHLETFHGLLAAHAGGRRVLEIGCASGEISERLLAANPAYIYGIDISSAQIEGANKRAIEGVLEFACKDASHGIEGQFDLIFGRSILHHVDYRPLLMRLYRENLGNQGTMIFYEPLGSNPLIRLYHLISRSGHTPDERPLFRGDLAWLKENFANVEVLPANLFSFIVGVPSSFISSRPDNFALRLCDHVDSWTGNNASFLTPCFRVAVIVIRKTTSG